MRHNQLQTLNARTRTEMHEFCILKELIHAFFLNICLNKRAYDCFFTSYLNLHQTSLCMNFDLCLSQKYRKRWNLKSHIVFLWCYIFKYALIFFKHSIGKVFGPRPDGTTYSFVMTQHIREINRIFFSNVNTDKSKHFASHANSFRMNARLKMKLRASPPKKTDGTAGILEGLPQLKLLL